MFVFSVLRLMAQKKIMIPTQWKYQNKLRSFIMEQQKTKMQASTQYSINLVFYFSALACRNLSHFIAFDILVVL